MIVVTGATGNVGRPLVRTLAAAGVPVRAVSRQTPVDLPAGVAHHRADLADPESLRDVVSGAEAFFLLVSGAGAHLDAPAILDVVKAGGVRRVVLLSSQAAGTRPGSVSHSPLVALENTVRQSGLEWAVLRPGGFASNALAWAGQVRESRTVTAPFGDVGLPVVDPADIAEVAAVALRATHQTGQVYDVTGPELSTPRRRAAAIAALLGEPVTFVEQSPAQARSQMLTFMPEPVADGTLAILGAPTPDELRISPHVEQLLGRPPRTFADWLNRHADAFGARTGDGGGSLGAGGVPMT